MNTATQREINLLSGFPPEATGFIVDEYSGNSIENPTEVESSVYLQKKHKPHIYKAHNKYRTFSNHCSANDQPRLNTSW